MGTRAVFAFGLKKNDRDNINHGGQCRDCPTRTLLRGRRYGQ
jgi:hypothetical protein